MKNQKLLFPIYFILAFSAMSINSYGNTINTGNELAWLQTDRDMYIAGENVFFKLYLFDADTHKPSNISKIAYLVLRNNANIPVEKIKLKVENGIAYGSFLLPDSLKSGVCQITTFTNYMRNFGEGSFFTKEIFVANRFDKDLPAFSNSSYPIENRKECTEFSTKGNISVSTDKTTYTKREKIRISLDLPDKPQADTARLTISVFEVAPGTLNYPSNDNYLSPKSENSTQSQQPDAENARFIPEVKGEIIQGYVINPDSKEPVANTLVYLSAADSVVNLQYTVTDSSGMFRFLVNDYYYHKELYFSVKDDQKEKKIQIIPDDKYELKNAFIPSTEAGSPASTEFIHKSQDIVSIQKIYEAESVQNMGKQFPPVSGCPQLYFKPNYCIYPADFLPLNDFAEIAREILPPQFSLKKRNDLYTANLADETRHVYFDQEPMVFLDGVYIDNVNQLMKLGSDKVKRVELVCSSYNLGDLIFPGILAVFSKTNEIGNLKPNSSSIRMQLQAFHASSGFIAPANTNESPTYQPDFRQLLYWNPTIEFSDSHFRLPQFYASDHSGNYIIRIEGITSGGIPMRAITTINVK